MFHWLPIKRSASLAATAAVLLTTGIAKAADEHACRSVFPQVTVVSNDAATAKGAGFDAVFQKVGDHLMPAKSDAEFAAHMQAMEQSPLRVIGCNQFIPSSMKIIGPKADHDAIEALAKITFQRAKQAHVKFIVLGSGGARQLPEGFSNEEGKKQFVALLKRLAPLAAANDVTIAVESLNAKECNFLNRVTEVAECVAAVNHPAVRVNADLYHMRRENEGPEALEKVLPWLVLLEIAEKDKRTVPGTAGDDFRPYFKVLRRHGWKGMLDVEAEKADVPGYQRMFSALDLQVSEASN